MTRRRPPRGHVVLVLLARKRAWRPAIAVMAAGSVPGGLHVQDAITGRRHSLPSERWRAVPGFEWEGYTP